MEPSTSTSSSDLESGFLRTESSDDELIVKTGGAESSELPMVTIGTPGVLSST